PPAEEPPAEEPPAEEPPAEEPPAEKEQEQPAPASPEAPAKPEVEDTESAAPIRGVTGRTPDPTESATPVEEEEPEPSPTAGAGGLNAPATDNLAVDEAIDDADSAEELADRLALTGTNTINVIVGGMVLVFAGVGLVYLTQRRRDPYRRR
ncbi:LPXTG cell wall anchor domain-containing protein, partial [Micromonospora sp. LOL_023]|uniref:LPXTG cell wall anchor domain-containing protein n=1 Tax=Micromonospora sp. LOL_023 TaxID=3345418 RepID=UPI003A83E16B